MEKQKHFFGVAILLVILTVFHSGVALTCYKCSSINNKNCESGSTSDFTEEQCIMPTQPPTTQPPTTQPPTTQPPTTQPSTTTETIEITETSTQETTTSETTTGSSTNVAQSSTPDSSTKLSTPDSSTKSSTDTNEEGPSLTLMKNRRIRSVFPNVQISTYADGPACAIIKRKDGNTNIFERRCITDGCPEGAECSTICYTDRCNNANAMTINMGVLGCLMLAWATGFILTDY